MFGFQHEYRDSSTGFMDLRARMYDPATASFLQADPASNHPDYTFGAGNPTMYSDPTGMSALDWFNEHLNPAYQAMRNCLMPKEGQGAAGKAIGCGGGAVNLGLSAFGLEQLGALAVGKVAALGAVETEAAQVPTLEIDASRMPNIARNIQTAIDEGQPDLLFRETDPGVISANRAAACAGFCGGGSPDEYPFASTMQGGAGARIEGVPLVEQRIQGGVLSSFYQKFGIGQGDPFRVSVNWGDTGP